MLDLKNDLYKYLLGQVGERAAIYGYKRRGTALVRNFPELLQIITFPKIRSADSSALRITCRIGFTSKIINLALGVVTTNLFSDCHWSGPYKQICQCDGPQYWDVSDPLLADKAAPEMQLTLRDAIVPALDEIYYSEPILAALNGQDAWVSRPPEKAGLYLEILEAFVSRAVVLDKSNPTHQQSK